MKAREELEEKEKIVHQIREEETKLKQTQFRNSKLGKIMKGFKDAGDKMFGSNI